MNPLKAGDIAPKFSLPDQDGEQVNLTDFQGQRVLVYFYPKAMTPGCTVQACGLRDNMDELKKVGVEVLGISTDKPEKLSRFAEKELLNFTLLSDEDHQVCEQFGIWGEKTGRSVRTIMAKFVAVGKASPQRKAVKGICFFRQAAADSKPSTRQSAGSGGYKGTKIFRNQQIFGEKF